MVPTLPSASARCRIGALLIGEKALVVCPTERFLFRSEAFCRDIKPALILFCASRRSSSYHHLGHPYSHKRPSSRHSLHTSGSLPQPVFLNKHVQQPKQASASTLNGARIWSQIPPLFLGAPSAYSTLLSVLCLIPTSEPFEGFGTGPVRSRSDNEPRRSTCEEGGSMGVKCPALIAIARRCSNRGDEKRWDISDGRSCPRARWWPFDSTTSRGT